MLQSLRDLFQPKLLFPSLTIGFVFGVETAMLSVAFALMIFSGDLASQLTIGITVFFLGGCIHALVSALGSSHIGMLSSVQDSPTVILAVIITAMLAGMPQASVETKLYTALAAIILTSLLTGLICLLLGRFKLGNLVSYIPYPVIGGFLAGTGWLLVKGSFGVMTDFSLTLPNLPRLLQPDQLLLWLPHPWLTLLTRPPWRSASPRPKARWAISKTPFPTLAGRWRRSQKSPTTPRHRQCLLRSWTPCWPTNGMSA